MQVGCGGPAWCAGTGHSLVRQDAGGNEVHAVALEVDQRPGAEYDEYELRRVLRQPDAREHGEWASNRGRKRGRTQCKLPCCTAHLRELREALEQRQHLRLPAACMHEQAHAEGGVRAQCMAGISALPASQGTHTRRRRSPVRLAKSLFSLVAATWASAAPSVTR